MLHFLLSRFVHTRLNQHCAIADATGLGECPTGDRVIIRRHVITVTLVRNLRNTIKLGYVSCIDCDDALH